jgi:hypothetical protein
MAAKPTMVFTPSPWPQLDELLRELEEVASSHPGGAEPTLSQASLAVSKAAMALTQAAGSRRRAGAVALDRALALVEDARQAVAQARLAIAAGAARRGERVRTERVDEASSGVEGDVQTSCPACGRPFVVRYRSASARPLVAFPVGCPADGCDGLATVEYPVSVIAVDVQPLPS